MIRRLSVAWRVVASSLAVLIFYGGGLLVGAVAIAACRLVPGRREAGSLRAQHVIHLLFRGFIALLIGLGILTCSRRSFERLRSDRGALVIANHPTLLDVVFLIAAMPRVSCIVKSAVWDNPFTRIAVRGAAYISHHEGPHLVDQCVERLARGHHVLIFPEGTRSLPGSLRRFHRGAAHIALRSGCEILPVVVTCDPPMLSKGMRWHDVPTRRPHFTLTVLEPISPDPFLVDGQESVAGVRRLTASLEALFARSLASPAGDGQTDSPSQTS